MMFILEKNKKTFHVPLSVIHKEENLEMGIKKIILFHIIFIFAFLFYGCETGNDSYPDILSFSVEPTSTIIGKTVTLSWSTKNADAVSIDNNIGNVEKSGTIDIFPETDGTHTYTLRAENSTGAAESHVSIDVSPYTWTKTFGNSNDNNGQAVKEILLSGTDRNINSNGSSNNEYIIGGSYRYGIPDLLPYSDYAYLLKIDEFGNRIWDNRFSDENHDAYGRSLDLTSDGGFILAGSYYTETNTTRMDIYLVKTGPAGNAVWTKKIGGSKWDEGYSVQQTTDGGYIITGYTRSQGSGNKDVFLVKTNTEGNTTWQKAYGGTENDWGFFVQQTSDGGYIVAGRTESYGSGGYDIYLIKTNPNGNLTWENTYGGSSTDYGYSVQEISDGGYIIAGSTESYGAGEADVFLVKTDEFGNKIWSKTFGGEKWEYGKSVFQTEDGGYIISGTSSSYNETTSNNQIRTKEISHTKVYIVKTDSSGNKVWWTAIGGSSNDSGNFIRQTADGGYICVGYTMSFGNGNEDIYIIRIE